MRQLLFFILTIEIIILSGCATSQVTLTEDVLVKVEGRYQKMRAGDVLEVKDEPLVIRSLNGNHSMTILPAQKDLILPSGSFRGPTKFSQSELNGLLAEVAEVQFMIDQSLLHEALKKIRTMRSENRPVHHLNFLEAKVLVMLGEDDKAKKILAQVLQKDPNDVHSQKLFNSLGGYDNQ